MKQEACAFAPAGIGNVAVGFDLLGQALSGLGDRVTVRKTAARAVTVSGISGVVCELPAQAEQNTAGRALLALQEALALPFGFDIRIEKGIPLGSGLGGSAASAVAAVVAANALLPEPVSSDLLYQCALSGEEAASGARHGDNVGPQLLGGLVLAFEHTCLRLRTPPNAWVAVAHPHFVLETRVARAALRDPFPLSVLVKQQAALARFVLACERGDWQVLASVMVDHVVEPRRAPLIPGFYDVKAAAIASGAISASISGAGPSVFAWFNSQPEATAGGAAMQRAFAQHGMPSDLVLSPLDAPGAQLEWVR